jgi:hypothetical protein
MCFTASLSLKNNKAVPEMALPFLFWHRLRIAGRVFLIFMVSALGSHQ